MRDRIARRRAGFFAGALIAFAFSTAVGVRTNAPEPAPIEPVVEPTTADPDSMVAWILSGQPDDGITPLELDSDLRRLARTVRVTSEWYDADPRLIARLIHVESGGDSAAVHRPITVDVYGVPMRTRAVGLGGIVPELWLGTFPECGDDLRRIRDNVCYTVRVWMWFRDRNIDMENALLAYNGCRRGWSCDWYAGAIMEVLDD